MSAPIQTQPYLPTSRRFNMDEVELEPTLSKMYTDIALAVNSREIGIYDQFQINTGKRWLNTGDPTNRLQVFRQVYLLAALPNAGTATIATGIDIDANTQFIPPLSGVAESSTRSVPIPYVNVAAPGDGIQLEINRTSGNIEITTTTANWVTFSAKIVLEYVLNN